MGCKTNVGEVSKGPLGEVTQQGCQIFLGPNIPTRKKYTKLPQTIRKGHKLYQMAVNYSKWSKTITNLCIPRPSKFYQNWDFWFENKPSGNPVTQSSTY
jgi:hypothetical protein